MNEKRTLSLEELDCYLFDRSYITNRIIHDSKGKLLNFLTGNIFRYNHLKDISPFLGLSPEGCMWVHLF